MYKIKYTLLFKNGTVKEIIVDEVKQPNFNDKVLSYFDVTTGQIVVYDLQNPDIIVKEIRSVTILKLEENE